jgi:hypothetical protein
MLLLADRDRLIRLLRMFSSNYDGEVSSAARRAHELLQRLGIDWSDIIVTPSWDCKASLDSESGELLRRCSDLSLCLTRWERDFIAGLSVAIRHRGRLTERQAVCLNRIVDRLRQAGLWD